MDRPTPTPRPRRLLPAALLVALALPGFSALAAPASPSATPGPDTPVATADLDAPPALPDVRERLDLDQMPFLDADGEYDPAGDASTVTDPLPLEPTVMGEGHGHAGHDDGDDHADHHGEGTEAAPTTTASTPGGVLPATRRPLVCAQDGDYRTVVIYAHLRGQTDARSQHLGTIRETMERSNQLLALSARESGGPLADLRAACTSGGSVSVARAEVTSRDFAEVKRQLASQGFDQRHEKYLVFADFGHTNSGIAGLADLFHDTRRSVHNHNNGNHAMYAMVYGSRHFVGATAMHELVHSMGAAQRGAPRADDGGHCTYTGDLLCRGGATNPVLDRGNDTYFSTGTSSGEWLHHHWNIGWEGNRFVQVRGRSGPNLPPTASFTADCTRATCTLDASASSDPDGTIERYRFDLSDGTRLEGRSVRHRFAANGTYEVTLTVTDDGGATATTTENLRVRGATAPTARASVTCDGMTCTFDARRSDDRDGGSIEGYRWRLEDGRTSTQRVWVVELDVPGRRAVELTVTDDDGWTGTTTTTAWPRSGDVADDTGLGDVTGAAGLAPDVDLDVLSVPDTRVGVEANVGDVTLDAGLDGLAPRVKVGLGGTTLGIG